MIHPSASRHDVLSHMGLSAVRSSRVTERVVHKPERSHCRLCARRRLQRWRATGSIGRASASGITMDVVTLLAWRERWRGCTVPVMSYAHGFG